MSEHPNTPQESLGPLCRAFDEQVSDLLLAADQDRTFPELARHRRTCPRCAAEWAVWSALVGELNELDVQARAERAWAPVETALRAERREEQAVLRELKALPGRTSLERTWLGLERAVRPRRWPALLEVAALAATAALLVAFLGLANQPALEWATRTLPTDWSGAVARFGAGPYGSFFSTGLFGAFSALACLVSAPLLVQGLRRGGLPRAGALAVDDRVARFPGART